jgi:acyl-CoA synthetase (NDP forming)
MTPPDAVPNAVPDAVPDAVLCEALLRPRAVAVVGASGTPGRLTARPVEFLRRHGFAGAIHPVNPGRDQVAGLRAWPSVAAIPGPVDHAYVLLDTEAALAAVADCAAAGVRVVSVLADGFAEQGPEGIARQNRLAAMAHEAGILLVGPNSTGVVAPAGGFCCTTNAAFGGGPLRPGRIAVLSQSGSMIGALLSRGEARGRGYSALISSGNEAAAGIGRLGEVLLHDPATEGFALFLESLRAPDELAAFAGHAARLGRPVVAFRVSRSPEGQALAVSHTGAIVGSDRVATAFLRSIGVAQAEHLDTLIDAPEALSAPSLRGGLRGRPGQVCVVTTTGGGGAVVVDGLSRAGIAIGDGGREARAALAAAGIRTGSGKLVDVTLAGTNYDTMRRVVETLAQVPGNGLVIVAAGSSARFNPELSVRPVIDAVAALPPDAAPVVALPLPDAPESLRMLAAGGVAAFGSVESCVETVRFVMDRATPAPPAAPPTALPAPLRQALDRAPEGVLDEAGSAAILAGLGLVGPAQLLLGPDAPPPDPLPLRPPLVAKLVSPDLPHKTEAGGVRLGLADRAALVAGIAAMRRDALAHAPGARLTGVLVQEQVSGVAEMLLGLTRDPVAGTFVTLGLGGTLTELLGDVALRPAPVSVAEAARMLDELRGRALLDGFRGRPVADRAALAQAVADFSRLALHPRVLEAEANPVLVLPQGAGVCLIDALLRLGPPAD